MRGKKIPFLRVFLVRHLGVMCLLHIMPQEIWDSVVKVRNGINQAIKACDIGDTLLTHGCVYCPNFLRFHLLWDSLCLATWCNVHHIKCKPLFFVGFKKKKKKLKHALDSIFFSTLIMCLGKRKKESRLKPKAVQASNKAKM